MRARRAALDRTLAALADPQRRGIIDLLREHPRPAGELARRAGISAPAMSRHLRNLRKAGLVTEEHDGFDARVRIYRLTPQPISNLKAWLEETEVLWSKQLLSFKSHIERTKQSS